MPNKSHLRLYQIAVRKGQSGPKNHGNVPQVVCALWCTELVGCGVRVWQVKGGCTSLNAERGKLNANA
jgi:hypothetical protein